MNNYLDQFKEYLYKKKDASDNTINSYITDIKQFLNYYNNLSDESFSNTNALNGYIESLVNEGRASSTIHRKFSSLKCYFNFLIAERILEEFEIKNIKIPRKKRKTPELLTQYEANRLISQPSGSDAKSVRDRSMLKLLYATGIKVSELIRLDISDIDLAEKKIVCKNKSKVRRIPVSDDTLKLLTDYIVEYRGSLVNGKSENALYVNVHGSRMTRQGFWKIVKYYKSLTGIKKDITPNSLRYAFAVNQLENGKSINDLKELLGHSDITTTKFYQKITSN